MKAWGATEMLAFLAKLFAGNIIGQLIGPLERAWDAKVKADTDAKRLEAEQQIAFFKGQIELATAAASNDKWWSVRSLMGYCAFAYVAKIVVWDTVLQLGVTPDPGVQVTGIVMTVIGFYFGSKAATDIAGKFLAAMGRRR